IRDVRELRGKNVAATRGTDPWFFLLQALHAAGLAQRDVTLVHLQHPDGEMALLANQVEAWAGLDPYMAHAEFMAGARPLFRPGEAQQRVLLRIAPLMHAEQLVPADIDLVAAIKALLEPSAAARVLAAPGSTR